jgi:hypothetical protein
MKSKAIGWLLSAAFILVVVAVAFRVSFIRNLVLGTSTPPAA